MADTRRVFLQSLPLVGAGAIGTLVIGDQVSAQTRSGSGGAENPALRALNAELSRLGGLIAANGPTAQNLTEYVGVQNVMLSMFRQLNPSPDAVIQGKLKELGRDGLAQLVFDARIRENAARASSSSRRGIPPPRAITISEVQDSVDRLLAVGFEQSLRCGNIAQVTLLRLQQQIALASATTQSCETTQNWLDNAQSAVALFCSIYALLVGGEFALALCISAELHLFAMEMLVIYNCGI